MELLMTPTSPFARKVRVFARERGLRLTETAVSPLDDDPRLLRCSPLGKVPALIDGERCLVDSRVIIQHLAPEESASRSIEDRVQEAEADGILDAAVSIVMERRRPSELRSEVWIERQSTKIARTLQCRSLEAAMPGSVGSLAFACALGYLDFRLPEILWREQRPELADAFSAFAGRPAFVETLPPSNM